MQGGIAGANAQVLRALADCAGTRVEVAERKLQWLLESKPSPKPLTPQLDPETGLAGHGTGTGATGSLQWQQQLPQQLQHEQQIQQQLQQGQQLQQLQQEQWEDKVETAASVLAGLQVQHALMLRLNGRSHDAQVWNSVLGQGPGVNKCEGTA